MITYHSFTISEEEKDNNSTTPGVEMESESVNPVINVDEFTKTRDKLGKYDQLQRYA